MMKNIKHNAAQVAAPSNLSSSRGDRFLRVCGQETSTARTMKHLLVVLIVWMQRIQMTVREKETERVKVRREKKSNLCVNVY